METNDPFDLMPVLWPVAFDMGAGGAPPLVHLTVDAPPVVSRPGNQYRVLCGWDAARARTATYLLDDKVLPRAEFHGGLLCSSCAVARDVLVENVIAGSGVEVPACFTEAGGR